MDGSLKELAGYRLARAKEMLSASEGNLQIGQYKTSLNRSYYAIFHEMRSVNALRGFDSSKHSGVIGFLCCRTGRGRRAAKKCKIFWTKGRGIYKLLE